MGVGDYGSGLSPDLWQTLLPYLGSSKYSSALSTQNKQMGNLNDVISLLLSPQLGMLTGSYTDPSLSGPQQQFVPSTPKLSTYKNSEFEDIRNIALGIEAGAYDDVTAQNMLRQAVLDGRLPGFTTDQTDAMVTQMWDEAKTNEANAIQFYADQQRNGAKDSIFGQAGLPTGQYYANWDAPSGTVETNYKALPDSLLTRYMLNQQAIANHQPDTTPGSSDNMAAPESQIDKVRMTNERLRRIDAGDVQHVQAQANAGGIYSADQETAIQRFDNISGSIATPAFNMDAVRGSLWNRAGESKRITWDTYRAALEDQIGYPKPTGGTIDQNDVEEALKKAQAYENAKAFERGDNGGFNLDRGDFTGGDSSGSGGYSYDYATAGDSGQVLNDTYLNLLKGKDRNLSAQAYGYAQGAIARGESPIQDAMKQRLAALRQLGITL